MARTFRKRDLDNGLTVLGEVDEQAHTAAVGWYVRAGARDETPGLMGVSHFLEHMMFKGTARRSADDVNREFDEIGADYNAFTSEEITAYYAATLPEHFSRAVDLWADVLRPSLRDADFEMERNVILEEIGMYEDEPDSRLYEQTLREHFGDHPLSHRVLGLRETVSSMTPEAMRAYHASRYGSDNVTAIVTGAIDFDAVADQIAELTADWSATSPSRDTTPPARRSGSRTLSDDRVGRHYAAMISPAPAMQDRLAYAAGVLANLLGDRDGSRLYWSLVDPGLAEAADLFYDGQDGTGSFVGFVCCDPQNAEEVETRLLETIDRAASDLSDEELERAKTKLATDVTVSGELPKGRMADVARRWVYAGEYLPLDDRIGRILAVDRQDVLDVLGESASGPRTLVRMTPAG